MSFKEKIIGKLEKILEDKVKENFLKIERVLLEKKKTNYQRKCQREIRENIEQ